MSDAKSLAKSVSQTLVNLVAVQYLRIWHRLRSDRLTSAVSDLLSGCEYDTGMGMNGGVGQEYSAEKISDDVSKLILRAAKCLQCMYPISLCVLCLHPIYISSSTSSSHSSSYSSLPPCLHECTPSLSVQIHSHTFLLTTSPLLFLDPYRYHQACCYLVI